MKRRFELTYAGTTADINLFAEHIVSGMWHARTDCPPKEYHNFGNAGTALHIRCTSIRGRLDERPNVQRRRGRLVDGAAGRSTLRCLSFPRSSSAVARERRLVCVAPRSQIAARAGNHHRAARNAGAWPRIFDTVRAAFAQCARWTYVGLCRRPRALRTLSARAIRRSLHRVVVCAASVYGDYLAAIANEARALAGPASNTCAQTRWL